MENIVIYQTLVRLFGNRNQTKEFNGLITSNSCGKFNDFTKEALQAIKTLGANYIWYTGILEHASQTAYPKENIPANPASIVKGKAGSPYAIRDYYDVDPDLAVDPHDRLEEFEALISRTHHEGLKVLIDFVPNHVARQYASDKKPKGIDDFGVNDYVDNKFHTQNNFYYLPHERFQPQFVCRDYEEMPAKASGNDVFSAYPNKNDWYECVKLNYGRDYTGDQQVHRDPLPDTWLKMLDILSYWTKKGVDGFRCDMAEMVPVEFWHWVIPQIKALNPQIIFIAEVYNPNLYRSYVKYGKFDFLYDKVGLYDTLKAVTQGKASASEITRTWQNVNDIQGHMLSFLENHDEQRIASDFYIKDGKKGRAALLVSALLSSAPTMIYMGQSLGEHGMDAEGFSGQDGRTSIFDYWSLNCLKRWSSEGQYSGEELTKDEKELFTFYSKVLNLRESEVAFKEGGLYDLQWLNYDNIKYDSNKVFAWMRHLDNERILMLANFSPEDETIDLNLSEHLFASLDLKPKKIQDFQDLLTGKIYQHPLHPRKPLHFTVPAQSGMILKLIDKA